MNLDIIGLAETHLIGNNALVLPGYVWFGQNRRILHRRAVKGSGGVGFFVKHEVAENHQVTVYDSTNEGVLWLQLATNHNQVLLRAAVCYLSPANSSRPVNAPDYFDTLLSNVHEYEYNGPLMRCGDFNSRIGHLTDCIPGADDVPLREVIDGTVNSYADLFLDFAIGAELSVLNGRISYHNEFTRIGTTGSSVWCHIVSCHHILNSLQRGPPPYLRKAAVLEVLIPEKEYLTTHCSLGK